MQSILLHAVIRAPAQDPISTVFPPSEASIERLWRRPIPCWRLILGIGVCRWWKLTKICRALGGLWSRLSLHRLRRPTKLHSLRNECEAFVVVGNDQGKSGEDDSDVVFPTPSISNAGSLEEAFLD